MRKSNLTKVSLSVLFSLTAVSYGLLLTVAPKVARAYTARVQLTISPNYAEESFETMMRRAEAIARAATQRSLDNDVLVTDVNVIIFIEHHGSTVPALGLKVSRKNWKKFPDPLKWTHRYPGAASLLKFPSEPSLVINQSGSPPNSAPNSAPNSNNSPTGATNSPESGNSPVPASNPNSNNPPVGATNPPETGIAPPPLPISQP